MRVLIILLLALGLAACASFGPSLDTARPRTLDYMRDDLASLLVAFDLPRGLAPVPNASTLSLDVVIAGQGERHIKALLTEADADDVAGSLVPPGTGRAYYLFGFTEADKAAIREAQAWARSLPGGLAGNSLSITLAPRLCAGAGVDPSSSTISVLVALPGQSGLAPLIDRQRLADTTAAAGGGPLPACG